MAYVASPLNLPLNRAIAVSLVLHILGVAALHFHFPPLFPQKQQKAMQVRLVAPVIASLPKAKPKKPVPPVRTQQSAAPKEAPKPKPVPKKPKKEAVKVVKKDPPKPPKKIVKKEDKTNEIKKRPEKLDKTPDKKPVLNDKKAKMVETKKAKEIDFAAALDFVNKLESSTPAKAATPIPGATDGEISQMREHINRFWSRPPGMFERGLSAEVNISLTPDGELDQVTIRRGSGNAAYDRSLLRAIKKAVPYPISLGRYEALKELELLFKEE